MGDQISIDTEALIGEIVRYLATVALFRAERCEPTWLPECPEIAVQASKQRGSAVGTPAR